MVSSIRRLTAITRKELRHITRDFRIFFLVTLSPAFLLFTLGYLFTLDLTHVNLVWLDQDNTRTSRSYLATICSDGTFRIAGTVSSYAEIDSALLSGQADLALVIPPGMERDLAAGRGSTIQAIADGSDAVTCSETLRNLTARTSAYARQVAGTPDLLNIATRTWYNGDLKSQWSMVPGLLAIVLSLPALALTLGISREQEVGTLEALIATPVLGIEYQLGKLLAYVLSGLVSATLAAGVAVFWFGVPFRGNFLVYLLLVVDFYLACMGVSMLVAHFIRSQQTAMLMVLLIFFVPGFFIAGLISPIDTSSPSALLTSNVLPATHFIAIARGIFLKGLGLVPLRAHALALAGLGGGSLAISLLLFRKQMD
jgi:ABC-2 type transport system permease protein